MSQELILLTAAGVWLVILSLATYYLYRFLNKLVSGVDEKNLKKVLEQILSVQKANKKELSNLKKELGRLENEGQLHVQKVGLIRFNPFRETGGDHSFSLAMLDGAGTGYILTGLHTRERTRIYLKQIKKSQSATKLSLEEKKALTKALAAS